MKNFFISLVIVSTAAMLSFKSNYSSAMEEKDYADCIKKYNSAWGENCPDCKSGKDSYKAFFRNECGENIDVMICAQETDKSWKKFMWADMHPKDTMIAYACIGTGKVKKWAKKAGDKSTTFPTIEEVNALYKE